MIATPAVPPIVVSMAIMANTVTVHDPRTDSEYQATRRKAELLLIPAGCTIVADETGEPVKKPRKSKSDTSATTEE